MLATVHMATLNRALPSSNGLPRRRTNIGAATRDDSVEAESAGSSQVAHTLTACTRCRSRKTRCDPGLPRCGPCERTNSVCEYYDSNRGHNVNRNYVVYLQHKVRELEEELDRVENEDLGEDPDAMMRAASVRVNDTKESKYLGPSSGIAITRLVMQLAKQFTDSTSIKDIVNEQRAAHIKELYSQEQAKPTSKVYPMISDVAATNLPFRNLTDLLVQLYKLKVQPMYPALHEPTLDADVAAVYEQYGPTLDADGVELYDRGPAASDYQHFVCRMVIAISLQKMDTQYAGLADSYYLAALKYLDAVVKPMDLRTLQCFALMAEYSLLTPTRTAIYYVVGLAVRLAQALGLHEEKTITRGRADGSASALEIDMRRRIFWCVVAMDYGLSHSLGRPAMLATGQEHIDVGWFETCDDEYITEAGIDPAAPRLTLKKWIAIHFFKMRLHQLEIRRKLYQRKRAEPKDDSDPWFIHMDAKITAWRDASPSQDEGQGLNKVWFIGRYNTMVVFMYRPSPQVPRPSLSAAIKCYDACEYNIYMHRDQINNKNVDLTWVFTQSLFMAINTMLWSLSYVEVRRTHKREDVEGHLNVAMEAISLASQRWPGVASAVQLYSNLIAAVLQIYDKDGDVPISANTPSDSATSPAATYPDATGLSRSRTTSPATVSTVSIATPPERPPPFGFMHQAARRSVEMPPPVPYASEASTHNQQQHQGAVITPPPYITTPYQGMLGDLSGQDSSSETVPTMRSFHSMNQHAPQQAQTELPSFNISAPGWNPHQNMHMGYNNVAAAANIPSVGGLGSWPAAFDPQNAFYPFPSSPGDLQNLQPYNAVGGQHGGVDQSSFPQSYWNIMDTGFGTSNGMSEPNNALSGFGAYSTEAIGGGRLTQQMQEELMHSLETDGMEDIQHMISAAYGKG